MSLIDWSCLLFHLRVGLSIFFVWDWGYGIENLSDGLWKRIGFL